MKIKKITQKVDLNDNVKAENAYECAHDCIVYYYVGKTAKKGCRQKHKVNAQTTILW